MQTRTMRTRKVTIKFADFNKLGLGDLTAQKQIMEVLRTLQNKTFAISADWEWDCPNCPNPDDCTTCPPEQMTVESEQLL
jgi:hypothetical protein